MPTTRQRLSDGPTFFCFTAKDVWNLPCPRCLGLHVHSPEQGARRSHCHGERDATVESRHDFTVCGSYKLLVAPTIATTETTIRRINDKSWTNWSNKITAAVNWLDDGILNGRFIADQFDPPIVEEAVERVLRLEDEGFTFMESQTQFAHVPDPRRLSMVADSPMVRFHQDGNSRALSTNAPSDEIFLREVERELAQRVQSSGELEVGWLKPIVDICCKLRGYKADVTEHRVIVAGEWLPSDVLDALSRK